MLGVSEEQSGGPCGREKQGREQEAEEEVGEAARPNREGLESQGFYAEPNEKPQRG